MGADPSAREWLDRLGGGEVSARELTEQRLARVEAVNARLNAVVACEPEAALAAAEDADRRRARGEDGPLLGLPLTVKDSLETRDLPSTGGSLAREGYRPERDAVAVARLRAAGAIVLAKTNVPEYSSSYETHNLLHGRTNNPVDPSRTPGGSSGGEGAIVGADASIAGLGADGGGSIRVPAHFCGIAGLRPTAGRVPETGNWPATRDTGMLDFACIGPMARHVEDLGLLLSVIAGPDGVDPYAVPAPLRDPDRVDVGRLRVGVYLDDGSVAVTPGTRSTVARAGAALEGAGAGVASVALPPTHRATELFFAAVGADGGERMRRDVADAGGRHHEQFAALLASLPPTPPTAAEWFAVVGEVYAMRAAVRGLLAEHDVLLGPVVAGPAPLHGHPPAGLPQSEYLAYRAFNYTHLHSLAGLPAGTVRAGEEEGLPVGVQVVGPPFREDIVLAVMAALEGCLGGFAPPPAADVGRAPSSASSVHRA